MLLGSFKHNLNIKETRKWEKSGGDDVSLAPKKKKKGTLKSSKRNAEDWPEKTITFIYIHMHNF